MASKIVTLVQLIANRGGILKVSQKLVHEIAEVFDSTTKRPISSMEAVQARHNFAKEHFRRVMQKPTFTMPETAQVVERPRVEPEHAYVLQ